MGNTMKKLAGSENREDTSAKKKLNAVNKIFSAHCKQPNLFTPENVEMAAKLLQYVKKANYSAIEKEIEKKPQLMFIQVKDVDSENISPLQFAFKVYDSYTWKMLSK